MSLLHAHRPNAERERPSRWMIKLASRTQGVVVRAASEFGDLTLSGPAWERVTAPISIQRFDTLLSHLPSQQARETPLVVSLRESPYKTKSQLSNLSKLRPSTIYYHRRSSCSMQRACRAQLTEDPKGSTLPGSSRDTALGCCTHTQGNLFSSGKTPRRWPTALASLV